MTKKSKNLPVVHFQVYAVHCFKSIVVYFPEITDFQKLILKFKPGYLWCDRLVIFPFEIFELKWINKSLSAVNLFESTLSFHLFWIIKLSLVILPTVATTPVFWHAAEKGW